ncbi:class I SAM-dependent DNA methyltransferase [Peterkaempfera bronchialis]|uniref:Class I SAM-dependent methyltransferase n=1 Tax=Peterkaempfera bronchialis TaxID=2126346 RepID=A0A345T4C0_9ACTN|nr:class I SAM-dependent methyltransferase [Peterkaempfera bronchialis]AXI80825.1 class I SAM-dependent methyltransferase [Peterkaempfera bronchialis]
MGDGIDSGYAALRRDRAGQAAAFDALGARYDEAFPHKEGQLAAGEWLAASLPPGSRVLDLGCGTGVPTARRLVDAGLRVVGIDLSPGMVERARANVPEADFHQADIADLRPGGPVDLGRFDAATAFFSLLMLPRAEIPFALAAIRGLLRERGLFALAMVEADADDMPVPFLGQTIRVSGHPRAELRRIVAEAGFEIVRETATGYAPEAADVPPEVQLLLHCRRVG